MKKQKELNFFEKIAEIEKKQTHIKRMLLLDCIISVCLLSGLCFALFYQTHCQDGL
jgi:hypothetical protein